MENREGLKRLLEALVDTKANAEILSLEDKARDAFDYARKVYYDCDIKCEYHAHELQRAASRYAVFVEAYS